MLYARIVLGVPVEGPFDYLVPKELEKSVLPGQRAWVSFGTRKMLGYVVGLSRKTQIKNPKSIGEILDTVPVLDKEMLGLTKRLSQIYCCSWGEAIETALPQDVRNGKRFKGGGLREKAREEKGDKASSAQESILLHTLDEDGKWGIYISKIKQALDNHKSVIVLFSDLFTLSRARERISQGLAIQPVLLYRKQAREAEEWLKIKEGRERIVLGMRSAIFAPFSDLGLVIVDQEDDQAYKQDQVPHYHARGMALERTRQAKASLILESPSPSLESIYLVKKNQIKYSFVPRKTPFPDIRIVDMRHLPYAQRQRNLLFSGYLQDAIGSVLNAKGKVLLFYNRKGFATFAYCHSCGLIRKCPRCNVNLVYYFSEDLLRCPRCNFKVQPPKICPDCNAGYIKYSGAGTEKIESELSRLFPGAHLKRIDEQKTLSLEGVDIFISTSSIIKQTALHFDLVAVIGIDDSLNRVDWHASEKTFALLLGLSNLTDKKMVIQTGFPAHSCFQALFKKDTDFFYTEELRQRKQLGFPPYHHIVLVKLRGKKEERVKETSDALFSRLRERNTSKDIRLESINPGQPSKLRGNYYWQILLIAGSPEKASRFLKICLKDFSHSGIIVTVDVDPV